MQTPHLIQRGKFRNVQPIGIDDLIQFDYMGSSEFEFNALPKSLKRICKNFSEYTLYPTGIKSASNLELILLYDERMGDRPLIAAGNLARDKYRLQERSYLKESLEASPGARDWMVRDFWWDLDNYFMLTLGQDKALLLVTAINKVIGRKRAAGEEAWYK